MAAKRPVKPKTELRVGSVEWAVAVLKKRYKKKIEDFAWFCAFGAAQSYAEARTKDIAHLFYGGVTPYKENIEAQEEFIQIAIEEATDNEGAHNDPDIKQPWRIAQLFAEHCKNQMDDW